MRRLCIILFAMCSLCMAQAQVGLVRSSGAFAVQKTQDIGPLTRQGKIYYYHGEPMKEAEMVEFIKKDCQEAYDYYRKQQRIEKAGWGIFGAGAAMCLAIGTPVLATLDYRTGKEANNPIPENQEDAYFASGMTFICVGAVSSVLVGVPMVIAGNVQKKNAHKVYNTWCGYKELETSQYRAVPLELKLISGTNGLGLALSF